MSEKQSIKISEKGVDFLQRLITNRRKADVDKKDVAYWKIIELMEKYFKNNNDRYLELVKMELGKDV